MIKEIVRDIREYCEANSKIRERNNGCVRYTLFNGETISFHRLDLIGGLSEALGIINEDAQGDRK